MYGFTALLTSLCTCEYGFTLYGFILIYGFIRLYVKPYLIFSSVEF